MQEKGMIHIYTGDGKGKTTAAIGLAIRAAGHGKRIYFVQFLKGRETGELAALKEFSNIVVHRVNPDLRNFFYQLSTEEKEILSRKIEEGWRDICRELSEEKYDILILDEIMAVLSNGLLGLEDLLEFINNKVPQLELVLTGRNAPEELLKLADYVTEMKMLKHPYQEGVPARKGIEF